MSLQWIFLKHNLLSEMLKRLLRIIMSLPSSMADFVPRDRYPQKAYCFCSVTIMFPSCFHVQISVPRVSVAFLITAS